MKLGDLIRKYREQHDLSQRQFAISCGLSNGYISMLEKGRNPKNRAARDPYLVTTEKVSRWHGNYYDGYVRASG